jgi:hypothetical protein
MFHDPLEQFRRGLLIVVVIVGLAIGTWQFTVPAVLLGTVLAILWKLSRGKNAI